MSVGITERERERENGRERGEKNECIVKQDVIGHTPLSLCGVEHAGKALE